MAKAYFILLFIVVEVNACEEVDRFISNLTCEKKNYLEHFAREILKDLPGYVLYGDKPVCNIVIYEGLDSPKMFYGSNQIIGYDLISNLSINPQDKKFPIVERKLHGSREIIFINRESFLKVVNENISLFRYILGRTLSAENFLEKLLNSGDGFYDVFKYNKLILGILLGYGTQNSSIVSREEDLECELCDDRVFFPFKDYKTFIGFQKTPSLGFSSIEDEFKTLLSLSTVSRYLKPFDSCPIPFFGCEPQSKETLDLLSMYEKNRETLIKIVEGGNVLSKFLERLCTTVSGKIVLPPKLQEQFSIISFDDQKDQKKIVDCIVADVISDFKDTHIKKESLVEIVLKGIEHKENDGRFEPWNWYDDWSYEYLPEAVFEWCLDVKKATRLLRKISQQKEIVQTIPGYVYHKVLIHGDGLSGTKNIKNVTFNFSVYEDTGALIECGTIKQADLEKLVPGIAHSLLGMRRGEEREIYMHPKYAYGWALNSSTLLTKTHLKLLDFEEGDKESPLPDVCLEVVKTEEIDEFLGQYKKIMANRYFSKGYYLWEDMKKNNVHVDMNEFSKHLKSNRNSNLFQNKDERRKFVVDYNNRLFVRDYKLSVAK